VTAILNETCKSYGYGSAMVVGCCDESGIGSLNDFEIEATDMCPAFCPLFDLRDIQHRCRYTRLPVYTHCNKNSIGTIKDNNRCFVTL
jgi:hypothetical protein